MKLLLTGCFKYSKDQLKEIEDLGYEITFIQNELQTLERDVQEFEAVVCNGLFLRNEISDFTNLKAVQLTSAGLDRFPVAEVDFHNVKVANAKGVYSIPIAEWVVLKILELYKDSTSFIHNQKNKIWEKKRELLELNGQTACVVGAGSIGTEIAKRLQVFGVTTIGVDISSQPKEYFDEMYLIEDLKKCINRCDVVILTVPLTETTYGMINKEMIGNMKDTAVVVNVARGEIINEEDLIEALRNKMIAGAILDVFEQEPLKEESPLWEMENVIVTPHNSFVSSKNTERLYQLILGNLKAIKEDNELVNQVK
ncbi:MAG: hydroxyacid dehydrogenase [Cellulosilyticum sp.]|nr:hydroxyacid dehydrogenase [Cellulosilyticum sp.]